MGIPFEMRTGHGYDAHRLTPGRRLMLLGADIPFEKGLDGHSDADVAAHALIDALLGAAGMGDIGSLFPSADAAYKDADSMALLREVAGMLQKEGWSAVNADVTIIAERPRLRDSVEVMRQNASAALGVQKQAVSVKATTTEGMGFEGAGQGMSAHAVVLICRQPAR